MDKSILWQPATIISAVLGLSGVVYAWVIKRRKSEAQADLSETEKRLKELSIIERGRKILDNTVKEPALEAIVAGFRELVDQLQEEVRILRREVARLQKKNAEHEAKISRLKEEIARYTAGGKQRHET